MSKRTTVEQEWPFVASDPFLKQGFGLKATQRSKLAQRLPQGVYWIKPGGRNFRWNKRLVTDFILNGDRPEHQQLVEQYVAWASAQINGEVA
jgi:hypothetical protein